MSNYKGRLGYINIQDNIVEVKNGVFKRSFSFNDITNVLTEESSSILKDGHIGIQTADVTINVFFSKKQKDIQKAAIEALENGFTAYTDKVPNDVISPVIESIKNVYKGGCLSAPAEKQIVIMVCDSCVSAESLGERIIVPYENIIQFQIESQEQIQQRYTATRLALLGPLALAFKKKKTKQERFLTIEFKDKLGMDSTLVLGGPLIQLTYNALYKSYSSYRETNPIQPQTSPQSVGDQLRELKSLVDEGILSPEEFELKKKELLQL